MEQDKQKELNEFIELLDKEIKTLQHELWLTKAGRKTSAKRARVQTLKLRDLFKEFRKISIKNMAN